MVTATLKTVDVAAVMTAEYPIEKFGGRWVCDGPRGRFHARTKAEAEAELRLAIDALEDTPEATS